MARGRILIAAVLAVAALAVLAGPATASAPAANPKFCKAANSIGNNTGGKPTKSQAKAAIKGFKSAAKSAPPKVKSAMNNIAKYLGLVANANSATDLAQVYTSNDYKSYAKSITTYVTYYEQQCSPSTT